MKYVQKALCAAVAALLLTGSAAPASAAETAEGKIQTGDVVCFGEADENCGFDGKWLVLDSQHTNDGQPGMYLVSLNLIGDEQGEDILFRDIGDVSVSFSNRGEDFAAEHPGSTDYQGSNIQAWCETFAQTHLSQAEYGALLPTHNRTRQRPSRDWASPCRALPTARWIFRRLRTFWTATSCSCCRRRK